MWYQARHAIQDDNANLAALPPITHDHTVGLEHRSSARASSRTTEQNQNFTRGISNKKANNQQNANKRPIYLSNLIKEFLIKPVPIRNNTRTNHGARIRRLEPDIEQSNSEPVLACKPDQPVRLGRDGRLVEKH